MNLNIAIPPIEIQNKIVEILDKLQAYTKDIQTGLPLEIDQRKKQYEHYRDKLLNFKEKNTKI
ncbi:restriction endonuclease subunit S [Metamycoplasma hominis]|uniref:restriction endonuclease subunit S n=1 Tax=Metamycoplasma hominis TaxID=2098 RepID=UPI003CF0D9B4